MEDIRKKIIEYYDEYKKENPNTHIPKLLGEEQYKKLNQLNKKSIRFDTLKRWSDSNKDIKKIKEYCEDGKNKIPLNDLQTILGDKRLAQKYNDFQNFLFNLYQYKQFSTGKYADETEEFQKDFEKLEKNDEEAESIYKEIKKKTTENTLTTLEKDKDKQIEHILKNKEISDGLNEEENEQIKKQAEEENKKIKKQASKKIEKMTAKIKNKKDDKIRELQEELDELKFKPMLKKYVDDKVKNSAYSLDKDQLINVIKKDIEANKLPEKTDAEKIYNDIKNTATEYIIKNLNRIKKLSVLTGYNNDLFNKLPPEVATIVQEEMNNKIQEDIRKKNRRYILPKELPRWERATQQHNVNPMLGRGAWSH